MSPVLEKACAKAWEYLKANPKLTHKRAAERFGVHAVPFSAWVSKRHPGELTAIRSKEGLPLNGSATQQKAPAR